MTKPTVSDWDDAAEIAFIAVDPRMTGHGIGRSLIEEAASVARENGRHRMATKTANTRLAQHYVRAHGATIRKTFRAGGQRLFRARVERVGRHAHTGSCSDSGIVTPRSRQTSLRSEQRSAPRSR